MPRRWTSCDIIELNKIYDQQTKEIRLMQWIFWDMVDGIEVTVAWRMAYEPLALPAEHSGWYWMDLYRVRSRSWRMSTTTHDPEIANRSIWPADQRRGI
ncbi:MAG: hypothetical protein GY869_30170, partial [Planctomycetes bacterium]|nr:hypothetical protein [Planctomycetota bacterium]